jgi:hypothetical protein
MSALTDRLYASWLAANGATRSPARAQGYGGVPPWKRSETAPVWKLALRATSDAENAPKALNNVSSVPCKTTAPAL